MESEKFKQIADEAYADYAAGRIDENECFERVQASLRLEDEQFSRQLRSHEYVLKHRAFAEHRSPYHKADKVREHAKDWKSACMRSIWKDDATMESEVNDHA